MVDFCPECSNMLRKKKMDGRFYLVCRCGYQQEIEDTKELTENQLKEKKKDLEKGLIIVSENDKISILPKRTKICPKCGHSEAETWQTQIRSSDEPSTSFFRCTKCKFTWREN